MSFGFRKNCCPVLSFKLSTRTYVVRFDFEHSLSWSAVRSYSTCTPCTSGAYILHPTYIVRVAYISSWYECAVYYFSSFHILQNMRSMHIHGSRILSGRSTLFLGPLSCVRGTKTRIRCNLSAKRHCSSKRQFAGTQCLRILFPTFVCPCSRGWRGVPAVEISHYSSPYDAPRHVLFDRCYPISLL